MLYEVITKKPEMKFDTEVWAAKPIAMPAMPAAPSRADRLTPAASSTLMAMNAKARYWAILTISPPERARNNFV